MQRKAGFRATQPTPSLRIACGGRNAHRAVPLLHGTGEAGVEKEKANKAPEAECREKPLPPLLAQIGGKGLFNPQKRNFLYKPHHTGIAKIEQIQRNDNIQTYTNKG